MCWQDDNDADAEFRVRLSSLVCGMGCALVSSWNKSVHHTPYTYTCMYIHVYNVYNMYIHVCMYIIYNVCVCVCVCALCRLVKRGDVETTQVALAAIEAKLPFLHKYMYMYNVYVI